MAFIYFTVLFGIMCAATPDNNPYSWNPFAAYKTYTSAWLTRVACLSCMACMGVSAFFHLYQPMSYEWNRTLLR